MQRQIGRGSWFLADRPYGGRGVEHMVWLSGLPLCRVTRTRRASFQARLTAGQPIPGGNMAGQEYCQFGRLYSLMLRSGGDDLRTRGWSDLAQLKFSRAKAITVEV